MVFQEGSCPLQNHHGSHLPIQVFVTGCWKRAISMTNHWICTLCHFRLSVLEMCCSTCSRHWKQASGEKERSPSRRANNKRAERDPETKMQEARKQTKQRIRSKLSKETTSSVDCIMARLAIFPPSVNETNRMRSWCRSPTSLHQKE